MKKLFKAYEYYLQMYLYVQAYSVKQAKRLLIERAKLSNGKWRFNEGLYEYTDKEHTIFHAIKF